MFKKILIKSEEDLPKEAGNYFFGYKNPNRFDSCSFGAIHYYTSKGDEIFWMKEVDWYLIESPISVPTETEIEKHFECHVNSRCYMDGAKWAIDEIIKRNK